ncbi:CARD- and ANK-domain containing inflammasome adapter protein-like [Petromyzon marinus]|uniref:E3 ubiquitin-protein ligase mib1-like n=1 Tax=Petromyzon marinus TaxID=7757 RepID=A0AAJ7TSD4_PETMA|nr:E3 ubiquitin-protein ligase mib1-like [Petromyzon marinus]
MQADKLHKSSNPYAIDVLQLRKDDLCADILNTELLLRLLVEHGALSYHQHAALALLESRRECNASMLEMVARSGERACRLFFNPCLKRAEPEVYLDIRRHVAEVSTKVGDSQRQLIGYLLEMDGCELGDVNKGGGQPKKSGVKAKVEPVKAKPTQPAATVTAASVLKAAVDGDVDHIQKARTANFNLNVVNRNREGPLHLAAAQGHAKVVAALLKAGVNVNARDASGKAPIHAATRNGHGDVVKLLLDAGADVVGSKASAKSTPKNGGSSSSCCSCCWE